ncbi:hypothetical protein ACHHYP_17358 [Achlya hypogyna]|uniref:Transmembrane protein n=1 Tax=Achlya hypogyna TaxID=1202772 RepID=A0A1V9Y4L5_ACHHY|nr:hypothetical protein ACHHYP_17358 [Achlya hypogyna]
MSVLPPTYLGAVVLLFVLVRLRHIISLSALVMHRVSYFLPPSDGMLAELNTPPPPKKAKNPKPEKTASERLQTLQLRMAPIEAGVLGHCLFFDLLDAMVIMGVAAMALFWVQQGVAPGSPDPSYYVLLVSLLLSVLVPMHIKFGHGWFSTTEAQLGVSVGALAIFIACFCIYTPAGVFDFDVDGAGSSMEHRFGLVFSAISGNATVAAPVRSVSLLLGGGLGLTAGIITATQFLPALRFARMYLDFISSKAISTSWKLVLHFNHLLPLLLALSFLRPIYGFVLRNECAAESVFAQAPRDCGDGWVTETTLRDARLTLIVLTAAVKFACFRSHLQYFLLEPKGIITGMLLQRGRIDTDAILDKILIPFSYIPVVSVQYLAPCLTYVASAMLLQRKAGRCFHWMEWLAPMVDEALVMCPGAPAAASATPSFFIAPGTDLDKEVLTGIVQGLQSFPVALPLWYETVLGFVVFWTALSWFVLSMVGIMYWRRLGSNAGQSVEQEDIVHKHLKRKYKYKQKTT